MANLMGCAGISVPSHSIVAIAGYHCIRSCTIQFTRARCGMRGEGAAIKGGPRRVSSDQWREVSHASGEESVGLKAAACRATRKYTLLKGQFTHAMVAESECRTI